MCTHVHPSCVWHVYGMYTQARILAIFDDLDTILLMLPLKLIIVGLRWELSIDLLLVVGCLALIWAKLHAVRIPCSWAWTMLYASLVTLLCEGAHFLSHDHHTDPDDVVETVHLEVLLPAFAIGCIARAGHTSQLRDARQPVGLRLLKRTPTFVSRMRRHPSILREGRQRESRYEAHVNTFISAAFMVLVGLSMPALFAPAGGGGGGHRALRELAAGNSAAAAGGSGSGAAESLGPGALALHVLAVSVLMVVGKLFPVVCYRDEASVWTRLALSLGMCPRGEVGAGVIVISLTFGIEGDAITIAVMCLAINLVASSFFIMLVKRLAAIGERREHEPRARAPALGLPAILPDGPRKV